MTTPPTTTAAGERTHLAGLSWAFLGVVLFSFSLPLTKVAVGGFSPYLTATGRAVMAAAARNLCPVTLELGGKSPAIVCNDFPLRTAAEIGEVAHASTVFLRCLR